MSVRSIPSHAAFPLAYASAAAEGKEIRFTDTALLAFILFLFLFKILYATGEDLLVHKAVDVLKEAGHISFTVAHLS
jgi:hypothetical protein